MATEGGRGFGHWIAQWAVGVGLVLSACSDEPHGEDCSPCSGGTNSGGTNSGGGRGGSAGAARGGAVSAGGRIEVAGEGGVTDGGAYSGGSVSSGGVLELGGNQNRGGQEGGAGAPASGGSGNGGDNGAGAPTSGSAGAGSGSNSGAGASAGEVGGGGVGPGSSGEGGSAGGDADTSCLVNGECPTNEVCVGVPAVKRCVNSADYCSTTLPCTTNSAGCVAHRCLPALPLGSSCGSHQQCQATAYCADGTCVVRPLVWGDTCGEDDDPRCGRGLVCRYDWTAFYNRCLDERVPQGAHGCVTEFASCQDGSYCDMSASLSECVAKRPAGAYCFSNEECIAGNTCGDFSPGGEGVCAALPAAQAPCATTSPRCTVETYCGTDSICHPMARRGEDCTSVECVPGLRCVDTVDSGQCAAP